MKTVLTHTYYYLLRSLREPAYVVSTLVFPSLFYLFFAQTHADTVERANFLISSFAAFAFVVVLFFEFGVHLSHEREKSWASYLNCLPVARWQILSARVLTGMLISLLAAALVMVVVSLTSPVDLSARQVLMMPLILMTAGIPMALIALNLGMWLKAKSALPTCNLVYLSLSFAGGLCLPPNVLPTRIQDVSEYLPSRALGECLWHISAGKSFDEKYLVVLALYAVGFAALFAVLSRRRIFA